MLVKKRTVYETFLVAIFIGIFQIKKLISKSVPRNSFYVDFQPITHAIDETVYEYTTTIQTK